MQKGVREKLHVYGPKGTREFHRIIAEDLYPNDIASRLTLPNRTKEGLDAEIHEVQTEGLLTDSGSWRVESVFTDHIKPHIHVSLVLWISATGRAARGQQVEAEQVGTPRRLAGCRAKRWQGEPIRHQSWD